jgi:hypothetical protein
MWLSIRIKLKLALNKKLTSGWLTTPVELSKSGLKESI